LDFLNFFIVGILILISFQYNYNFFSVFIIIVYSLFYPTLTNLLFIVFLLSIVFVKTGEIQSYWWYLSGLMVLIILVSSMFGSNKKADDSEGYDDLLKMLGKQ